MKTIFFIGFAMVAALSSHAQEIQFEQVKMDYGTIKKGDDGLRIFKFKNVGQAPLVVTEVKPGCGCTVPIWSKEPIMPGESGTIEVKYSTQNIGDFSKFVTVASNDSKNPSVQLNISGKVE